MCKMWKLFTRVHTFPKNVVFVCYAGFIDLLYEDMHDVWVFGKTLVLSLNVMLTLEMTNWLIEKKYKTRKKNAQDWFTFYVFFLIKLVSKATGFQATHRSIKEEIDEVSACFVRYVYYIIYAGQSWYDDTINLVFLSVEEFYWLVREVTWNKIVTEIV